VVIIQYSLKNQHQMKMKFMALCLMAGMFVLPSCKKDKETTPTPPPVANVTVRAISPSAGPKSTLVAISGTNFGTSTAVVRVYFNDVEASISSLNDTLITALVPVNAGTGTVRVVKNSSSVNGPSFEYYVTNRVLTVAGSTQGFTDGNAAAARFNIVSGVVKDASGNLFVCDRDNHRIRKITPEGVVSTFAGGTLGFVDGTGTAARFNQPYCIAIDAAGNFYVGDRINHAIRKITPAGVVTTLAGNGTAGDVNGTGSAARFNEPIGIAVNSAGVLYVADYINQKIKKVTPAGVVTTYQNILAFGLAIDAQDNLYATGYYNHYIYKYNSSGVYEFIAGQNGTSGTGDGIGADARFNFPAGIAVDAIGNLYVCDAFNNRIRKISASGVVSTLAGNNTAGFTDGIGTGASFDTPLGICGDFGNKAVIVADFNNSRIRKVIVD
jgi:sugar lactone lactonase YvrE